MDNHATTPVDPAILEVFVQVTREYAGNPASTDHLHGAEALKRLEEARAETAEAVGAHPREVVFTSGSTESNNVAIRGLAKSRAESGRHIVTSAAEHSSVFETCRQLEADGWLVTYVDPDGTGAVLPKLIERAMTPKTVLVSVMAANHEVGTLNDIAGIAKVAHAFGALYHCDATQAIGSQAISFADDGIDLMSLSGHKVYAPRGTGALVVRKSGPRVRLEPIQFGGGQERGIRPGTVNVAGAAALAAALTQVVRSRASENARIAGLRDAMWGRLVSGIPGVRVNGSVDHRIPGNLSVYIPGVEARALVSAVRNVVSVSTGSACATAHSEPSRVLLAMGKTAETAYGTIRIGLGRFNRDEDVVIAAEALVSQANTLRQLSST